MCLSTAAQAACCFEASISEVTTSTGGISSGAVHPDPESEGQCPWRCDQENGHGFSQGVCFTPSEAGELLTATGVMFSQLEGCAGDGRRWGGGRKEK